VNLYSTASGNTTITADGIETSTAKTIQSQAPNPVVEFYSDASGLRISKSKSSVIADGVDYTVITVAIIDESENIVSNYSGTIDLTTGVGYFEGGNASTTLVFDEEGSKSINLYSEDISESATVTAEANDTDSGFTATAFTSVSFTQPETKNITFVEGSVLSTEQYGLIRFEIEVTGADVDLTSMLISWSETKALLDKIEIMSLSSSGTYFPIINTDSASSPHTETISTILYRSENDINNIPDNSFILLTFIGTPNIMKHETIYVTFYDNENSYPITVYVP